MFVAHHTNFGTVKEFATFDEAKAWVIKCCFEASIMLNGQLVGTFSPISGFWKNPAFW